MDAGDAAVDGGVLGHLFEDGCGFAVAGGGDEVDQLDLHEGILFAGEGGQNAGADDRTIGVGVECFECAQADVGTRVEGEGADEVVEDFVVGLSGVGGGEDFAEAIVGGALLVLEELVTDELGHFAELRVLLGDLLTHGGELALGGVAARVDGGGCRGPGAGDKAEGQQRTPGEG